LLSCRVLATVAGVGGPDAVFGPQRNSLSLSEGREFTFQLFLLVLLCCS